MRKSFLLAAALCALLVAAPGASKTVTVDISKAGFVPSNVALQTGDTITFTNKDTANHQVVCQACPFTSPVLKTNETFSYQFLKAGKFTYTDPLNKNRKGAATVTAAPAALSLSASRATVTYGGTSTLSGTLSTQQAGEKIDVLAQTCGAGAFKAVTSVTTSSGGAYSYAARPTQQMTFQARYNPAGPVDVTSSNVTVKVRPLVALRRLGVGRFTVSATAATSLVGKAIGFQRYVTAQRKWLTVRTVVLAKQAQSATPLPGSIVSSVSLRAKLKAGLRVRAVLPPAQAAPCYTAAKSSTIRS